MTGLRFLAPLILAAGVIGAIMAAPTALADPLLPSCQGLTGDPVTGGQTTECSTPGNTQIDSTPPQYGMYPWDDEDGFFFL
jgi:hypothetical protein